MKNMKSFSTLLRMICFGMTIVSMGTAMAEPLTKHPRVAELEDSLREATSTYLRTRFPDRPFMANVSVDPLRRSSTKNGELGESLPYFDGGSSEEIQDEWDDPQLGLHALMLRTSKITVQISLNDTLNDAEAAEIKESLFRNLHLIPARDEIQLSFRSWATSDKNWFYPALALILAGIFLAGFFMIQRASVGKIAHALKESGKASGGGGGPSPMSVQAPTTSSGGDEGGHSKGGLNISDPFKARELVGGYVAELTKRPVFPTLKTMIVLDQYGARNSSGLGAILGEFSPENKKKLFSLSPGEGWFEAMNHPAMMTMDELELMQNLVREGDTDRGATIEEALVRVWRLGEKIPDFMRGFPKDTVLSILSCLPKNQAIKAARKAIPGAWADLLDPDFVPKALDAKTAEEIGKKAEEFSPLQSIQEFRRHQSETELREFLLIAAPDEEREIYLASRPDSSIHKKRPPFYSVFDQEEEVLKDFVGRFRPVQWALALFNVSKTDRTKIQKHLNEKQNFLFIDHLKRLDAANPDLRSVGQARESIALALVEFEAQRRHDLEQVAQLDKWAKEQAEEGEKKAA